MADGLLTRLQTSSAGEVSSLLSPRLGLSCAWGSVPWTPGTEGWGLPAWGLHTCSECTGSARTPRCAADMPAPCL